MNAVILPWVMAEAHGLRTSQNCGPCAFLETNHGHASVGLQGVTSRVEQVWWQAATLHQREPSHQSSEHQIVHYLGALLVDLRIDFVNKRAIHIGKADPGVMRRRAHPDALPRECARPLPDPDMMPRRERIVQFLEHQIWSTAVQQQYRNRRLLIA